MLEADLFTGERLRLAALVRADAGEISAWYADAEFLRLYAATSAYPQTEEHVVASIAEARNSQKTFLFGLRTVCDDRLVGQVAVEDILWTHRVGWVSIALGRRHWGQGYGQEGLRLIVRYAFAELNLYRLQLTVFDYNERALAIYRKQGFLHEGVFRRYLLRDGQRHDMLLMGLLADEWRSANGAPSAEPDRSPGEPDRSP